MAAIAEVSPDETVYVDETGIDTYLNREYGWSMRGEPILGIVSGRKFKRVGMVAAQRGREILSPLQYDGTMDSALFETWFASQLLPALPKNTKIVMDNASFHRKSRLFGLVEKTGHRLIFLPPYSPELNPIENFWAWLKRNLRKTLVHHQSFDDAICSCFTLG